MAREILRRLGYAVEAATKSTQTPSPNSWIISFIYLFTYLLSFNKKVQVINFYYCIFNLRISYGVIWFLFVPKNYSSTGLHWFWYTFLQHCVKQDLYFVFPTSSEESIQHPPPQSQIKCSCWYFFNSWERRYNVSYSIPSFSYWNIHLNIIGNFFCWENMRSGAPTSHIERDTI